MCKKSVLASTIHLPLFNMAGVCPSTCIQIYLPFRIPSFTDFAGILIYKGTLTSNPCAFIDLPVRKPLAVDNFLKPQEFNFNN